MQITVSIFPYDRDTYYGLRPRRTLEAVDGCLCQVVRRCSTSECTHSTISYGSWSARQFCRTRARPEPPRQRTRDRNPETEATRMDDDSSTKDVCSHNDSRRNKGGILPPDHPKIDFKSDMNHRNKNYAKPFLQGCTCGSRIEWVSQKMIV